MKLLATLSLPSPDFIPFNYYLRYLMDFVIFFDKEYNWARHVLLLF